MNQNLNFNDNYIYAKNVSESESSNKYLNKKDS